MSSPLRVGLTGGIGAGKSLVGIWLRERSVPVYLADPRAQELIWGNDKSLRKQVQEAILSFSSPATKKIPLSKILLKEIILGEKTPLREKILSLIHKAVYTDYQQWIAQQNYPYLVHEAALIFETGMATHFDKIIVVHAELNTRIQFIQRRDPERSLREIKEIINKQLPAEYLIQKADHVIYNHKEIQDLYQQVEKIHQICLLEAQRDT
ncbi:MAG: dephospho-CoA kinase [Cytophagales bacterium]|nr:dephospho-CoA kinase [Cytophagales bacterium]